MGNCSDGSVSLVAISLYHYACSRWHSRPRRCRLCVVHRGPRHLRIRTCGVVAVREAIGPRLTSEIDVLWAAAGVPSSTQVQLVAGVTALMVLVIRIWGAAAFARSRRAWPVGCSLFMLATVPITVSLFVARVARRCTWVIGSCVQLSVGPSVSCVGQVSVVAQPAFREIGCPACPASGALPTR